MIYPLIRVLGMIGQNPATLALPAHGVKEAAIAQVKLLQAKPLAYLTPTLQNASIQQFAGAACTNEHLKLSLGAAAHHFGGG